MVNCIITPTAHILNIASNSPMHLLLAHIALKDSTYVANYKRLKNDHGHYLIMDNSAFELGHSMDIIDLLAAADSVNADEIVAPEVFGNLGKTIEAVHNFIPYVSKDLKIGAVTQGNSMREFLMCYETYELMSEIHVIHVPMLDPPDSPYNQVPNKTLRIMLNRIHFLNLVSELPGKRKPVHLLGLTDGAELMVQKRHKFIRSNDSSSAFIHGYFGVKYTAKGLPVDKIPTKMNFVNWDILSDWQKDCIIHNIITIKRFSEDDY